MHFDDRETCFFLKLHSTLLLSEFCLEYLLLQIYILLCFEKRFFDFIFLESNNKKKKNKTSRSI